MGTTEVPTLVYWALCFLAGWAIGDIIISIRDAIRK